MAGERTPQKTSLVESILIKLMPQTFSVLQRSQSSVEIRQSPKGVVEFTVKCYADSVEEAQENGLTTFTSLKNQLGKMEVPGE